MLFFWKFGVAYGVGILWVRFCMVMLVFLIFLGVGFWRLVSGPRISEYLFVVSGDALLGIFLCCCWGHVRCC